MLVPESLNRGATPPLLLSLVMAVMTGNAGFAQEVKWLAEIQNPPQEEVLFDTGHMEPLLRTNDGHPVTDADTWAARRRELVAAWHQVLGPSPEAPSNRDVSVIRSEQLAGVIRSLIRYECEAGLFVEAYLLRPQDTPAGTRLPGIVALHPTTNTTIDDIAGLSGSEPLQLGMKLAKRGFVVICPRCFLWQDAASLPDAVAMFRKRHPNSTGMRKMLFDAQRALDILLAQPDVDPKRIGAVGHSLGAKEVLYLSAFDERIRAAVASEGGMAFKSTNWDAPWYLGKQIHDPSFTRNHHELLALIAPRAFLILAGETGPGAADGDRSWPLVGAAMPVHAFFHQPPRLGLWNHGQGHSFSTQAFERTTEWLETYLRSAP